MSETSEKACYLDLPPGLHGVKYRQQFVRAPESMHPQPSQSSSKAVPENDAAMRMSMGR